MTTQFPRDAGDPARDVRFVGFREDGARREHADHQLPPAPSRGPRGWGHRLLMLVCCIPMLVLVIALVASGAAGGGAILFAMLCIGMMVAMMFLMPGGHRH